MPTPVKLDFSKAQPISQGDGGVTLDFSKAQPIAQSTPAPSMTAAPQPSMLQRGMNMAGDVLQGVGKGAMSTLSPVLGGITYGVQKGSQMLGVPPNLLGQVPESMGAATSDIRKQATPTNMAQKVGHGGEQVAEFLIPGGAEKTGALKLAEFAPKLGRFAEPLAHAFTSALGSGAVNALQGGSPLAGAAMGAGGSLAGSALKAAAPTLERAGLSLGNMALGARGPKAFKYDANAARGAFDEGVLPAWSKHSASVNVENALPRVGQRISDKVSAGGTAPLADIANSIDSPLDEARGIIQGPGGGGRSTEPIEALRGSMGNRAPGALNPIYGPQAGTPFTASEASAEIARPGRLALPPPTEDIPLGETPYTPGRLSKPIIIEGNRAMPREFPSYGANPPALSHADLGDVPGEAGPMPEDLQPWGEKFNGMKFNENIGERPGTFGGGQAPGVLRRAMEFPESEQPSGLSNLTHPHATASDLWKTIQNLDKNTRFNPDPEVEGVNELRRAMRGGLRGNLEDAVPGLKPETQRYSDLKQAEDALDRTMHGGMSIGKMLSIPSTPIESTVGAALYHGSKAIPKVAPMSLPAATGAMLQANRKKKEQ